MPKSRPRDHTVLPKAHLCDYFGGEGFQTYDLRDRKWESWGPNTFGRIKGYYEPENKERQHVAWYIAASLFRNSALFNELLPGMLENVKQSLYPDGVLKNSELVRRGVDEMTSDGEFQRSMHGAWFDHAEEFSAIAENIYGLTWHILHVARKPNYLLLIDRPFTVHLPASPTQALVTFPISSEVMLLTRYRSGERWIIEPIERNLVLKYGRHLVTLAYRYVAAPFRDSNVTRMIERLRPAETPRTT